MIISLTSYPPRFASLALTLRCLLSQTVSADRTILWVTAEDYRLLPASVIDLRDEGLEIRFCKNIRSYKKIIPALLAFPDSYIVTADDDVYYSSRWLEELVELAGKGTIVCHRAHSVKFDEGGQIEPYDKWGYEAAGKGSLLFPTGVGGVLYGPGSLSPDVLDEAFMQLCPQADDVWLFWMGRRAGSDYVKTRKRWSEVPWSGTQGSALHLTNVAGKGNDEQIKSMVNRYGLPSRSGELKRRPFNADEMIARIQRMLDTQGILTADECRSIWADGPTITAPIPLAVSSPATTGMVEAPADVTADAAIPAAHS
ncbi:glycosyltransferase family 2 protein [Mesorhizobium qingshengii]|uniref:glycosyltransferase family 2 protein n=1 Tax=Mesorhizobium qingshengii TaxID=1165689 RepID=UPI00115FAE56|nr:glycosyltransferase family 2 protein [Mesorhizobium qingshengii]